MPGPLELSNLSATAKPYLTSGKIVTMRTGEHRDSRGEAIRQTSQVVSALAKSVFEGVEPIVLFAMIMSSVNSCTYAFQWIVAFNPVQEGVSIEVAGD